MKLSFTRPALGLALALGLSACGGEAQFDINGVVTGLNYPGLVLHAHGMFVTPQPQFNEDGTPKNVEFTFPQPVPYGMLYSVEVKMQPPHQTCQVVSEPDTAGRHASIMVGVQCLQNVYKLSGKVTGLPADGSLTLANGSEGTVSVKATTAVPEPTFTFEVYDDRSYGLSVLQKPATHNCTVSQNGVGIIDRADVANILVTCSPNG